MQTANGAEILIHVGIDTVNLQGRYFTPKAKAGDFVRAGQLAIRNEGYDTVIPVIVTNTADYGTIEPAGTGVIKTGDNFLKLSHM